MTATDRLVKALGDRGYKVDTRTASIRAKCPGHDGQSDNSLSLRQIEGQALVHCFGGCQTVDVLAALGLTMSDLFDEPRGATYTYTDALGSPTRLVHRTPNKKFPQSGDTKGKPQLYRLPAVVEAVAAGMTVYLVEGEKDVHALESLGAVATTTPMGATNLPKTDLSPLAGARVVVVPDADKAGETYLRDALDGLNGLAASVSVARVKVGKDAADHVAAGYGLDELVLEVTGPSLDIVTASDVELSRVVYVWEHRIPRGAMTLMPGEEGIGKTTVGIRLMADLTRGTLPGEHHGTPRDVLVIATEDGLGDVFVPRLREASADLTRVHIVRARIGLDGSSREVIVPRDLAVLGDAVRRFDVALVWIDSLVTTLPDELKSISYKDTAKVLRALGAWAEAERVAVAAPWHLNKATGSDTAVRIMDSRAFRTAIRSMLLIVADPEAPEGGPPQGLVALDQANAGTLAIPALRYQIRPAHYVVAEVDEQSGEIHEVAASCGVVEWIGQAEGDGRELARSYLAPKIERDDGPGGWLRGYLEEHGEVARPSIIADAKDAGFSLDQMKRASRRLRVHSRDESGQDENGRPYRRALWSLPPAGAPRSPVGALTHPSAPTAPTGEGSHAPTTSIEAGRAQSVRLVRSEREAPDWGSGAPTGAPAGESVVFDWRDHATGDLRPCRLCGLEAVMRDDQGRPCHKGCAEVEAFEMNGAHT